MKIFVSTPVISIDTSAWVVPVTFSTPSCRGIENVSWKVSEKSVRSIVVRSILFMPLTTEVSPEIVIVLGSILMTVFASVAPAPYTHWIYSGTSFIMLIGIVTVTVGTSNSRPVLSIVFPSVSISTTGMSAVRVIVRSSPPIST